MLVKFEQKSCDPNYTNFSAFWQKTGVFKPFSQSVVAILDDVSVAELII